MSRKRRWLSLYSFDGDQEGSSEIVESAENLGRYIESVRRSRSGLVVVATQWDELWVYVPLEKE